MSDPIEYVRERLAQQDQRLTPQRETVLRVLLDHADTHLTAEEVYLEARNRAPELGLATVYRTLDLFARLGVVRRLDAGEGVARYEFHPEDRKSTRLNSSHVKISYAVFCLKTKN